jgi:hypothetical protein
MLRYIVLHGIRARSSTSSIYIGEEIFFDCCSTMGSTATSSTTTAPSILSVQVSEKLTKMNYPYGALKSCLLSTQRSLRIF